MSDSKAREAAARAIFAEDGPHTHPWEMQHPYRINEFRSMANAAIDAYIAARREAGFVEVPHPRMMTRTQAIAYSTILLSAHGDQRDDENLAGRIDEARAMLNAAGEK